MALLLKIFQRLAAAATVLLLSTFLLACLVFLLPGDPAELLAPPGSEGVAEQIAADTGLDSGPIVYYFKWLGDLVQGDLGTYYQGSAGTPVSDNVKNALPASLQLILYTQIVALLISVPLGILTAYRENKWIDRVISSSAFALASFPGFALGLILILVVGVNWGLLPPVGYVPFGQDVWQHFRHMILPVATLAAGLTATYVRLLRADVIGTLKEDFVTMAASKGISNKRVLWRHVLRPSSSTLLTSAALNMGALIGGTLIIENIFVIPGLGSEIGFAIATRQVIALQTLIALIAIAYVIFNTVTDLMTGVIDPRTRERAK
jgi:peptide/nickel transport system permease protein